MWLLTIKQTAIILLNEWEKDKFRTRRVEKACGDETASERIKINHPRGHDARAGGEDECCRYRRGPPCSRRAVRRIWMGEMGRNCHYSSTGMRGKKSTTKRQVWNTSVAINQSATRVFTELVHLLNRLILIENWRRLLNSDARRVLRQELIYLLERRVLVGNWRRLPRRRCPH